MSQPTTGTLKKTALNAWHRAHGARMVAFANWEMPVEYKGVSSEHLAVRRSAGLFDVSHMGQIEVAGRQALPALQYLTSNDVARLKVGQVQYSGLLTERGTFVDDPLVYRFGHDHFLLVVNAANVETDFAHITEHLKRFGEVAAVNSSSRYAML